MTPARQSWRAPISALAVFTCACAEPISEPELPEEPSELLAVETLAETVSLPITRDTTLRQNTPNLNEGSLPSLSGPRSLLAVESAALNAALGEEDTLLKATLRVTPPASGHPNTTLLGLYRLTKAWTELGATWNCAVDSDTSNQSADCSGQTSWSMDLEPPNPFPLVPTAAATVSRGNTAAINFDVTADVQRFLNNGSENKGWLILSGLAGTGNGVFQSREGAAPPTLVLSVRRCGAEACDDGNACTADVCDANGFCVNEPVPNGTACDDGDACTVGEQCSNDSCVPGDVVACGPEAKLVINEVESSGGTPGDWIELFNAGSRPVDASGWGVRDNDDTHDYALPTGSLLAPGAYLVVEEAALTFGLGGADSARLFDRNASLVDHYDWTAHAGVTYGRCPNGSGSFKNNTSSTKGAENDCSAPPACVPGQPGCKVVINEVESNAGVPGDWIELYNTEGVAVDVSGWIVRDNDDTHTYAIPAGSSIAPTGYLVVEEASLGFGLGAADSARLFSPTNTLVDSYSWTAHASTTYGRCPNGSGAFSINSSSSKGGANDCTPSGIMFTSWPGGTSVSEVDLAETFSGNLSGLAYEPDLLWGVVNSPSLLYKLAFDGSHWVPEEREWQAGKTLLYPSGTGSPDAEGVTRAEWGTPAIYVATERDNDNGSVSRMSILRYDTSDSASTLTATHEWNLTADLPTAGANAGLEAIAWIPDADLVSRGFIDESTSAAYDPALYANHGTGVFFVGSESSSLLYAYVLDHVGGSFHRVATAVSGQPLTTDLAYDRDQAQLWSYCDDACGSRGTILKIQQQSGAPDLGKWTTRAGYERPSGLANVANEGIAIATDGQCSSGSKPFFWADDADTGGFSVRQGTVSCGPLP